MLRQDEYSSRHSQSRQSESSQSHSGIRQVLPTIYRQEPEQQITFKQTKNQKMLSFVESLMADIDAKDQQLIAKDQQLIAKDQQLIALNEQRNEQITAKNTKIFQLENQLRQFKLRELYYE
ncbi:Hypothetical_protein [Hexamita inflata]|uniref:Hypothetical_protein n=1 Tax=Hexamita inflata TaxID=28002 RepID=A0AA86QCS2_9EUKA|nr:Hypothetical protein HINF_LOCUS44436 [Hexamita inflata]